MTKRFVRERTGTGKLESPNGQFKTVVYEINEYRQEISAASHDDPHATLSGNGSFEGTISSDDGSSLPLPDKQILCLHFANGQRLKVLFTEWKGASSAVVGTGGIC